MRKFLAYAGYDWYCEVFANGYEEATIRAWEKAEDEGKPYTYEDFEVVEILLTERRKV